MGAEQPAQYIIGLDGQALYDTGLCTNLRDLARFGQLMLEDGRYGAVATHVYVDMLAEVCAVLIYYFSTAHGSGVLIL
jgi:CubicO group peptidase (beta-lactamase class C family)